MALVAALLTGLTAGCLQGPTPGAYRVDVVTEHADPEEADEPGRAINGTITVIVINRTAWGSDDDSADLGTRAENDSARYGTHAGHPKLLTPPPPSSDIHGEDYRLDLGPDGRVTFRVPVEPPIMLKANVHSTAPSTDDCNDRQYSGEQVKVNVTEDTTLTLPFDVACYDRVR